jgi:hypothetical protein
MVVDHGNKHRVDSSGVTTGLTGGIAAGNTALAPVNHAGSPNHVKHNRATNLMVNGTGPTDNANGAASGAGHGNAGMISPESINGQA